MKRQIQVQTDHLETTLMNDKSNEVDIGELIKAVWHGKLVVMLVTFLFALGGVVLALSTQEWWSTSAKITEAQPQNLVKYQQQVKQFQPVFNVYQDDGTVLVSNELDNLVDSKLLFKSFVDTFNSSNNKRSFLNGNEKFHDLNKTLSLDDPEVTGDTARILYSQWSDRITALLSERTNRNSPYLVSFQSMTQESSFDLLLAYISATESNVHQDAFNNLQAVISGKRNELIQQKAILETQAKNQLLVETERARYAMEIAKAAGVEAPIQVGSNGELFGIDLGAKGLKAKVQALESVKNLSVIEPRLQQINAKLSMLSNLNIDRSVKFQMFRYLENAEQPTTRDKPKRALIVVMATLFGGMLGVAIVLIRFMFRKED
ncbi:LPS O-antigen chain length determinant protein WzzB [Vibrio sp. T20]|uniref:LPS O-antigen chain length determinant protein WzzB n=1 Tax=Vibrio sp. T20 TaxID=2588450 RepID=UPI0039658339